MFANTFIAELARRMGERVEISTDNNQVTGILSTVAGSLVLVIETNGYSTSNQVYLTASAINAVRILSAA